MNMWLIGFAVRMMIAGALLAIGIWLARRHPCRVGLKCFMGYYAVRLLVMAILVCGMNQLPTDIKGWFLHANWMNDGYFPGKDFHSPYCLGFNFLLAASTFCLKSPYAIVFLFTAVEAVALLILYFSLKRILPEINVRRIIILYLSSPIITFTSWFGAQDEVFPLLGISVLIWLFCRNEKAYLDYVVAGVAISFTKILSLFYLQPFFFIRRYRTCLAGFVGAVVYFAVAKVVGVSPFDLIFSRVIGMETSGDNIATIITPGNIWHLFNLRPGNNLMSLCCLFALGCVTLPFLPNLLLKDDDKSRQVLKCCTLAGCLFMTFSLSYPMTFTNYAIPVMVSILVTLLHEWRWPRLILFFIWSSVMSVKEQVVGLTMNLASPNHLVQYLANFVEISSVVLSVLLLVLMLKVAHENAFLGTKIHSIRNVP